jgi:hypothetical protein
MNKIDLVSKLLAEENISVRRANVSTASFNIKDRVLTLPAKFNLSENQEMLLVLHEVGHALFTGEKYIQYQREYDKKHFSHYMNCVEDARIERLVKDRYPGCRKDFFNGYNEFHSDDFFGIQGRDVNSMNFIDRLNLHFKLGTRIDVKFNVDERKFVRMVESTKSEMDVFTVAKAIYEYAAEIEKQSSQNKEEQVSDEIDNGDYDFDENDMREEDSTDDETSEESTDESTDATSEESTDDETSDESTEESTDDETSDGPTSDETIDESTDDLSGEVGIENGLAPQPSDIAPEMETQKSFDGLLDGAVINDSSIFFETSDFSMDTYVFPVDKLINFVKCQTIEITDHSTFQEFNLKNDNLVNSMAKEFLMKRAAEQYQRTTVAKSGSLDVNKLSQYRIADDIFKKYNITCDTTSHGIVVLLDWSVSIFPQLSDLIKQVITVVKFCRKVDIKCEVYAFSQKCDFLSHLRDINCIKVSSSHTYESTNVIRVYRPTTMIQFMTSYMRKVDFTYISEKLFHFSNGNYKSFPKELLLDSTPLMPAVKFAMDYIPEFRQKFNLQKVTLVVLTDGIDNTTRILGDWFSEDKKYLRDPVTNKFHMIDRNRKRDNTASVTSVLLKMIRERYSYVTTIGFLIFNTKSQLQNSLRAWGLSEEPNVISRKVNSDGVHVMEETRIFSKMFTTRAQSSGDSLVVSDVTPNMTSSQISKIFGKSASSLSKTKVFVKSFIETIA